MTTTEAKHDIKDAEHKATHSAAADKTKGNAKQVAGTVKEKVGHLVGDRDMEANGMAQRADGKKDHLKGEIKDKVEDVKDNVKAGVEVIKDKFRDGRHKP